MNPFDDDAAEFVVLVNQEVQYSLWPTFAAVPNGWTRVFGPGKRRDCVEFVERTWTDMRPRSLAQSSKGH